MKVILSTFYKQHQLNKEIPTVAEQQRWLNHATHAAMEVKSIQGYRKGVRLIPVTNMDGVIRHKTVTLQEGEPILTDYVARVPGEEPRKMTYVKRKRSDLQVAENIFVVLYHKDVLAEDGEVIDGDWAIVAHVTSSIAEPEPIGVGTLLANHFHLNGGTKTGMSPEDFEQALKKSVLYWKDKVVAVLED